MSGLVDDGGGGGGEVIVCTYLYPLPGRKTSYPSKCLAH